MKITIETTINAPLEKVWTCWTTPEDIIQWNTASDDWHTTAASNDLRTGGRFKSRMEAKDKSMRFDFEGTYEQVILNKFITYVLDDGRSVQVTFSEDETTTLVTETFDAESLNPPEMQREGWQSILNNFKKYVEAQ